MQQVIRTKRFANYFFFFFIYEFDKYADHFTFSKKILYRTCIQFMAVTEMVHNLILAPDFFGAQEVLALKNLSPKNWVTEKYGFHDIWAPHESHHIAFS